MKNRMKTILSLLSLLNLFGCATNKDPVWSQFYYPQEVLLKPAPKAESSRVQGKSTFLQNEAEFKEHMDTLTIDMKNLIVAGIYTSGPRRLDSKKLNSIVSEFGGDRYEYFAYPMSPTATFHHIWIKLSPERQKQLHKQGVIDFTLPSAE
jgi:hypothetical protein